MIRRHRPVLAGSAQTTIDPSSQRDSPPFCAPSQRRSTTSSAELPLGATCSVRVIVLALPRRSGHSALVRLTRWEYVCGSCGSKYDVASADLSFAYGTFLARTRSGVVATWNADGSVLDEVERLIEGDPRVIGRTRQELRDLVHQVVAVSFDPDPGGEHFALSETTGCPQCGSASVAAFTATDEFVRETTDVVTHAMWHNLTDAEHATRVRASLDRLLDGA